MSWVHRHRIRRGAQLFAISAATQMPTTCVSSVTWPAWALGDLPPGEGNSSPLQYSWQSRGQEEPGGLQSMGSQRVRHGLVTKPPPPPWTLESPEERVWTLSTGLGAQQKCPGSVQFSSVTQSCPTLCDPMNCSTPGLPVHHQLPEFTETHAHRVGDAIQPSRPLC